MAKRSLVIDIIGNNKLGRSIRDAMGSLRKLGSFAASVGRGIATAFKFAAAGIVAGFGLIGYAVKTAFDFEAYKTQIRVLVGSMEEAERVFKDLADFSARTPFELSGIIGAYQQLRTFTDGALSTREGLELVGDAAAARGKDFSEVAYWVGRLYSALKNGDPFMDSVGALQRLGVVGGEIRGTLKDLTKSGVNLNAKWAIVTDNLLRFKGGMAELSLTGKGLFSTLRDNWTLAVQTFGSAFADLAKDGITRAIDTIKKLREDGTIDKWAKGAADAVTKVSDALGMLFGDKDKREAGVAALKQMFQDVSAVVKPKFEEWGEAAGAAIWRGFKRGGSKVAMGTAGAVEQSKFGQAVGKIPSVALMKSGAARAGAIAGMPEGSSWLEKIQAGTRAQMESLRQTYAPGSSASRPLHVSVDNEVKLEDVVTK